LEGQVTDTILKGETSVSYALAECGLYEWVLCCDTEQIFLDSQEWLRCYVEPPIDIGTAMLHKVSKVNGEVKPMTSVRSLTRDELQSPDELQLRNSFFYINQEED
jgi:hypothetical protein